MVDIAAVVKMLDSGVPIDYVAAMTDRRQFVALIIDFVGTALAIAWVLSW